MRLVVVSLLTNPLYVTVKAGLASQAINRFVSGGLDNPCGRGFRDAGCAPLIDGGGKRFLRGFFGDIEITEIPYQSGNNSAPIRSVDCVYGSIWVRKHIR